MKWPWKSDHTPENEPEHEAVSERLGEVEEEIRVMSHRILLLEVEAGLYSDEFQPEH